MVAALCGSLCKRSEKGGREYQLRSDLKCVSTYRASHSSFLQLGRLTVGTLEPPDIEKRKYSLDKFTNPLHLATLI
jgi:hypothetical protein